MMLGVNGRPGKERRSGWEGGRGEGSREGKRGKVGKENEV